MVPSTGKRPKRRRDVQKFRTYRAQDQHWFPQLRAHTPPLHRRFPTWEHLESYADTVWRWALRHREALGVPRFVSLYDPILRQKLRGSASHADSRGRIDIASCGTCRERSWTDHTVLHELAHLLTPNDVGHGREWAGVYLKLVRRWMGREAANLLQAAFRKERVKYTPKRVLSAARKAELRKRIQFVRIGMNSADIDQHLATEALSHGGTER